MPAKRLPSCVWRSSCTPQVHIYRLVSENTIEENILRKSDQKRQLDYLAIQSGGFTTDMLAQMNLASMMGGGGSGGGMSAEDIKVGGWVGVGGWEVGGSGRVGGWGGWEWVGGWERHV